MGVVGLLGASIYSYTKLSVSSPRVTSVSPFINNGIPTLLSAGADLAAGNVLSAAEKLIAGVEFDLEWRSQMKAWPLSSWVRAPTSSC
jgi:hypothetical protein